MTEVPGATPVTTPVTGSIVAIDGLPLLHVPSAGEQCNVVVEATHTLIVPVITPGKQFDVTVV